MKRYLVIGNGSQRIAIPYESSVQLGALVASLAEATIVNSNGYGSDQKYIPANDDPIQMEFIEAGKFTIGDDVATLTHRLKDATKQNEQYSGYWMAERAKTERLEKRLAALENPTPSTPEFSEVPL